MGRAVPRANLLIPLNGMEGVRISLHSGAGFCCGFMDLKLHVSVFQIVWKAFTSSALPSFLGAS